MILRNVPFLRPTLALLGAVCLGIPAANAQPLVPIDVGQTVNGFQDDFDGPTLNPDWKATGTALKIYSVADGLLKVMSAMGDPNHLLYAAPGYDPTTQEVLARIRITAFGEGDPARGGVAVGVDASSSQGINLHFRNVNSEGQSGHHTSFLDDLRVWGPGYGFGWQTNSWYWLRLRQEPDVPSQGAATHAFGKIWPADGSTAEPIGWQTFDYSNSTRTGFAGIAAGSSGGISEFEVDYILIKAAGLPEIVVAPHAFPLGQTPVVITNQPLSQSVGELSPVTFSVGAEGNPQPQYQWFRNNQTVDGATNAIYSLAAAALADDQAIFTVAARNIVSNVAQLATSSAAVLTVIADTTPPALTSATAVGLGQVRVTFSERLDFGPATTVGNFTVTSSTGPLQVVQASLDLNQTTVALAVNPMTEGTLYTLTVNGVTDRAAARNRIATDSRTTFTAVSYQAADIGSPSPGGTLTPVAGGYDLASGGSDVGGTSDQFFFTYLPREGDFDLQVRIERIDAGDLWAKAGLMARASLSGNSPFAAVFGTVGNVGTFFQTRASVGGTASSTGSFAVNYPDSWLRLKRAGNLFTGYAGWGDGVWTQLGSANLALPLTTLVGFAVCSHAQGQVASARFRDFSATSSTSLSTTPPLAEPLGQSSRLTPVVFSEIMYAPLKPGATDLEFVELANPFGTPEDISGYRLSGDISYLFPPQTVLAPGAYLVVGRNPADVQSVYGITQVLGPYTGSLPKGGGTLRLRHRTGAIFLEVKYETTAPWPVAPSGLGHSLVLARPSFGEHDPRAWAPSDVIGGSPGRADPVGYEPLRRVVINEFLAHTDDPLLDYLELYNPGPSSADVSGCRLGDDRGALEEAGSTNLFQIPANTVIPPQGFVVFDQNQLGFALNAGGETIYLVNSNRTRVLDALTFDGQAAGVSSGRFPDGAPDLYPLTRRTPGAPNSGAAVSSVVINEIMYAPISGDSADEYVELYNRSSDSIDVGGWEFTKGISFSIPSGTQIPPDGYLVIAKNVTNLLARYPATLTTDNTIGNYGGTLGNKGERLVLSAPDPLVTANRQGVVSTNTIWTAVDEVTYGTGGRWGVWAAGGGSSLELTDPRSDHRRAPNWADSDETAKAPWTTVSYTGKLDNGDAPADELQVLLQGAGECLMDDVAVLNASGVNLISNSSFESGTSGWTAEGTEEQSGLEDSGGVGGGKCYHVRASDRGDNQVNRIRTRLKSTLASGTTGTIRAKVRWLKGHPEILFRLRGKWLEAEGKMTLPPNPGTPGARNSRFVPNGPPAIFDVRHFPVLPAPGEPIRVTACVHDPDGVAAVTLNYRLDPSASIRSLPMLDDGSGGDAVAGDGVFTAVIPGQTLGSLVAFHVKATDAHTPSATASFPTDAPVRECLARVGDPVQPGNIPAYRLWITQATFNIWSSRHKLNNTPLDFTFVLGNHRVIYNAQGMFAGSPYIAPGFTTPAGNRCGYSIILPSDDPFLGSSDLVLDWAGGHGNENTAVQEEMAYWLADHLDMPFSLRHYIRLTVNGVTDMQRGGIFEAIIQPAGPFVKAWSPDDPDGDFYKIDRGFEFNDSGGLIQDPMPRLQIYTTTGGQKKTARYRWNWLKRSYDSANNYTNIFNLADALNAPTPEPYTSRTEALVDVEEFMRVFAFEHIINNFDSWGHIIGKNMYAYKPQHGKWQLYVFDLDWLMLVSTLFSSEYTGGNGPLFAADDPTVTRMFTHPPFLRAYYRAVQDAVDGPLASTNCDPVMDAKYQWLVANGVNRCDGAQLAGPPAVKKWFSDRRRVLQTQVNKVSPAFALNIPTDSVASSNLVTLTGVAPIKVKTVEVNGVAYEPTWTTVTNFSLQVPLRSAGTNLLSVQAYDLRGMAVTNANATVTIVYNGSIPWPSRHVVINEWMASNKQTIADPADGNFDDWFELYNGGAAEADLAGYYLTGNLADPLKFSIPDGYRIPAGGFLLVWADNEEAQNQTNRTDLHVNFKLTATGNSIGLFAPDGTPLDTLTFGPQLTDVSQGRSPDGSTNVVLLPYPTPRTPNPDVRLAPRLQLPTLTGRQLSLAWQAIVGRTYRVESKHDLNESNWQPVTGERVAASSVETLTIPLDDAQRSFYRVMLVR